MTIRLTSRRGAARAVALAALGLSALAGLSQGACYGAGNPSARSQPAVPVSKDILDKMLRDSRQYLLPEGLPGRQALLDQLPAAGAEPWQGLTPIQSFFLFEVAPDTAKKAPASVVQAAYCAALETLPGEWFTPYRSLSTDTSIRMKAIDGIEGCLLRQLDNTKLVQFGDSEAHANASLAQYQVGDLAALFLAARHKLDYDMNAPPAARKARRDELKKQLQKG